MFTTLTKTIHGATCARTHPLPSLAVIGEQTVSVRKQFFEDFFQNKVLPPQRCCFPTVSFATVTVCSVLGERVCGLRHLHSRSDSPCSLTLRSLAAQLAQTKVVPDATTAKQAGVGRNSKANKNSPVSRLNQLPTKTKRVIMPCKLRPSNYKGFAGGGSI